MAKDWTPCRAELPLDPMEAFRLASFGIAYVPQYAPLMMDPDCSANRFYNWNGASGPTEWRWQSYPPTGPTFSRAELDGFSSLYATLQRAFYTLDTDRPMTEPTIDAPGTPLRDANTDAIMQELRFIIAALKMPEYPREHIAIALQALAQDIRTLRP